MAYGDIRDVLFDVPNRPNGCDGYRLLDLFTVRHDIIAGLSPAPRSVFEFGALVGYFLITALDAAPSIRRVGWVDNETHTGGSNEACAANLRDYARQRRRKVELWWDTADAAGFGQADLVQVDGDHTYGNCLADLIAAKTLLDPKVIMVDDYGAHQSVIDATDRFAAHHGFAVEQHATVNGLAVLLAG